MGFYDVLDQVLDLLRRRGRSLAHCDFGTLYAKIERRAECHAALTAAVELYRAMEMILWLPQTEAALAQVAGQ